jgi:hypothetical protein
MPSRGWTEYLTYSLSSRTTLFRGGIVIRILSKRTLHPSVPENTTVPPLEQLFRLEIVYYRRLRTLAPGTANTTGVHTSYALQCGYEQLINQLGTATARDIEQVRQKLAPTYDTRDLLAARDSLKQFLGLSRLDA